MSFNGPVTGTLVRENDDGTASVLCFDGWSSGEHEVWQIDMPVQDLVERAADVYDGTYEVLTEDMLADYDCTLRYDYGTAEYGELSDEVDDPSNGWIPAEDWMEENFS